MLFNFDCSNFWVIFEYLRSDLIKKQRSFKIGLISIFLVVFFIGLLINIIELSPNIFLRLSEESIGEADFIFTPSLGQKDVSDTESAYKSIVENNKEVSNINIFQTKLINFTDLKDKLKNISFIRGIAPRWIIQSNTTSKYDNQTYWAVSNIIILDSKLENQQGMGRKLHLPILTNGEAYISESIYKSLRLNKKNDKNITLTLKPLALYKALQKVDVNSASLLGGQVDDEYYDTKKKKEKEIEEKNKKSELNLESEAKFIKSLIKMSNFSFISITKGDIVDLLKIPENFTISISLLKHPLIRNIVYVKEILNMLNDTSSFLHLIFDVDYEKDTISLKHLDRNFTIRINILDQLEKIPDELLEQFFTLEFNLTAAGTVSSTSGKWPSASGNVVAIDVNHINSYLQKNVIKISSLIANNTGSSIITDFISKSTKKILKEFDLTHYTLSVNAVITNKFDLYQRVSKDLRQYMAGLTKQITDTIGYSFPIQVQTPIYTALSNFEIGSVFMKDSFIAIMIFLWILSVLLVYSLMLGNVDERTYEFGLLRSLGFKKNNLTGMIIIQGFIFAIPGVILGLTTCFIVNNYISFLLNWHSGLVMPFNLSFTNIFIGIVSGLSIPVISSYLPIKKALSENLKETLTIFNKKIGDLVVSMIKLEHLGISMPSLIASIIIITIGFSTYYLGPSSLLSMDYSVTLFIMTGILIVMLLGLIILFQLFIPHIQKFILSIIMFFAYKDRNIHFIITKNLEGHHKRNKKISLMFMVALGYIIFSGSIVSLVVSFVKTLTRSVIGGDIMIWISGTAKTGLNEVLLSNYLDKTIKEYPNLIVNYTFVTYPIDYFINGRVDFSTLNGYPKRKLTLYGIDPSFAYSIQQDLLQISEVDKSLNYSLIKDNNNINVFEMLDINPNVPKFINKTTTVCYPNQNRTVINDMQINVLAAEGLRREMGITTEEPCLIQFFKNGRYKIPVKIVSLLSKLPGFPSFSSYSSLAYYSPLLMSKKQMKEFLEIQAKTDSDINTTLNKPEILKKTKDGLAKIGVIIKFNTDSDESMRDMVFFEIKNIIEDDGAYAQFVGDIIQSANKVEFIMNIVLLILGLIALILSFFLIWTSFYSSIKENICEFGIMRSIGLNIKQSTRMYLYEALCIILTSIITGTFLGFIISVTLILQFDAFAELPFKFSFPFMLYFILSSLGIFLGMLGSYYPIYEVNHISLVKIMKGLS